MSILEFALEYAKLGWLVIPVMGKRPVGNEWEQRATCDPKAVKELFKCEHDGLGVQLGQRSNLIDFDCDSPEAEETFQRLFGGEITTPSFLSTRGKHRLFKWTDKLPQGSIKITVDGLEIRLGNGNKGCQTVFPPSGSRNWTVEPSTPIAEIPADVIKRICERWGQQNAPKKCNPQPGFSLESDQPLDVPKWLKKHGHEIIGRTDGSDGTTRWHIECPNIGAHTTPNNFRDCCVTQEITGRLGGCCFHSSCGMNNWESLRDTIGAPDWSDYNEEPDTTGVNLTNIITPTTETSRPEPKRSGKIPNEVLSIGGILGRLLEHNHKTALGPMPELALAGGISLMSVITGHKVKDFRNLRTNTYVISLAPSGAGKDDARKVNKNILRQLKRSQLLAPTKIKSSAGMISALVKQNPTLFQLDELSGVLRTMRDPERNPHMADVITVLLEAWSEATGTYEPGAYADSAKNPSINQPHLCIYGTAVANEFWGSLTKRNLVDGLVGRLMVFEHIGYPDDSDGGHVDEFSQDLIAEVASWLEFEPHRGDLHEHGPAPQLIEHTDEALERYVEHRRSINARKNESEVKSALWRRCNEKAGKLAMIAACSRNPPIAGSFPKIELCDVNWGIKLANWLTNNMLERSQFKTSDTIHEQNLNKILDLLQDWTRKEIIGQKIRSIRADERNKILGYAIQDGLIEVRTAGTGTKTATEYRATQGYDP